MKYPVFKQLLGVAPGHQDGVIVDRAADGSPRSRSTWDKRRRTFTVRHLLDQTDYDALLAFYDACRGVDAEFDFEWRADQRTYRCLFAVPPVDSETIKTVDGIRYPVVCNLIEV